MKRIKNRAEIHPIHKLMSTNIIRLRKNVGLTQVQLAEKSELTHNFINDVENAKKGLSASSMERICKSLKAEPFQLFLPLDFNRNEVQKGLKNSIDEINDILDELNKLKEKSIFLEE